MTTQSFQRPRLVPSVPHVALDSHDFAARLIELRDEHNLSKEAAAQRLGVSHRHYIRWEQGQIEPRRSSLDRVAAGYGITVSELIASVEDRSSTLADRLDRIEQALFLLLQDRGLVHAGQVPDAPADLASTLAHYSNAG